MPVCAKKERRNDMAYNVLITGGSRGIGAAAVREFAKAGYNVAFTWHNSASTADAVVQDVRSACPDCRVVSIQADAGDAAQVRAAVSKAEYELGVEDGMERGTALTMINAVEKIVRKNGQTVAEACNLLDYSVEQYAAAKKMFEES